MTSSPWTVPSVPTTKSERLLKCPHCGHVASMVLKTPEMFHAVECLNISCLCSTPWCKTAEDAIAIWNRRDTDG